MQFRFRENSHSFVIRSRAGFASLLLLHTIVHRRQSFTAKELEEGAISICRALDGEYTHPSHPDRRMKINGDLTKVRYSPALTDAGRKLLDNLEYICAQIPGTMAIRKTMRFATHAGRLTKGVPIFVTWSPDEKHNVLMLRLSRTRRNDPLNRLDKVAANFGGLYEPSITNDAETLRLKKEDLLDYLPAYDDRRAILARDSLASVEGFRLSVLLTCEYLFGMRVCIDCPKCNHVDHFEGLGCSDLFGSNALPEGGIFG